MSKMKDHHFPARLKTRDPEDSPEHHVGMAISGLRSAITHVQEMAKLYPDIRKDGAAISLCADDLAELAAKIQMRDAAE